MFNFSKNYDFKLKDIDKGHHHITYKGVKTIKCPFDYVLYQMLIGEIRPDLIIEIGTNRGGSTLYLADLLELYNKGEIHTIDLPGNEEDKALRSHPRIRVFNGGYSDYDTSSLSKYPVVLIIEDGSHQYGDVLAAMEKFSSFVTKGSYLIVEDGIVNELGREKEFNGGPQRAIKEFLTKNHDFIIDRKWCDFFGHNATFNVDGYLKKVR